MEFNEDEFKKNWDSGSIPTINLNCAAKVANNDQITIFQYPLAADDVAFSQSTCRVIGELVSSYSSIKYFPLNQLNFISNKMSQW